MPHRANRWSLAGAAMVGAAALVVVVVLVMAAGGGPSTVPVPAASASHAPASSGPPSLSPTAVPEQPVVGFGFSAVDDPPAHQLVLFGGVDSYDTTWLWTGSDWSLARPSLSPPGRFGAAAAYDPLTRVVMLFGGRLGPGDVVNDTWAWNGTTWRELNAGTAGPPPGEGSVMAWDDTLQTMVLVTGGAPSGETWVWGGGRWVRRLSGDLPVAVSSMAVDPVTHLLLAVGWTTSTPGNPSMWRWDGAVWRPVGGRTPPSVPGLVLDPASNRLLSWSSPDKVGSRRQTWSWSGNAWNARASTQLPGFGEVDITGVVGGHVLLLGWLADVTQGAPQPIHIWAWTGSVWARRA